MEWTFTDGSKIIAPDVDFDNQNFKINFNQTKWGNHSTCQVSGTVAHVIAMTIIVVLVQLAKIIII